MSHLNISEVSKNLKVILKKKGMTYLDLAEKLEMSESGVQKIFSGSDITLSKLAKICKVLKVSVGSIIDKSEDLNSKDMKFTSEQERFLIKNPEYFDFYWALKGTGFKAERVKEKFNLDDISLNKYLLKLDKLNIIKLEADNKIKTSSTSVEFWKEKSALSNMMLSRYQKSFLNNAIDKYESKHISLGEVPMSEELQKETYDALVKLYYEYFNKAVKEVPFIDKKEGVRTGTLIVTSTINDLDYLNIPRLT